jgi:hypothetical protein
MRAEIEADTVNALERGAVFFDLHRERAARLDVFTATIRDGCANVLNRRLFVVQSDIDGSVSVHNPTVFHEIVPLPAGRHAAPPEIPSDTHLVGKDQLQALLVEKTLSPFLDEVRKERLRETQVVERHVETSLNTLLNRETLMLADLVTRREAGSQESGLPAGQAGLEGRIKQVENRIEDLQRRLDFRRSELARQRECSITDIRHLGRAWVLPHPERHGGALAPMRRDDEIERIARKSHAVDLKSVAQVRFVEVKGRAFTGEVALTYNEYKTAERLKQDYWLYVVFQCASPQPSLNILRDPARLHWQPIVKIEHYRLAQEDQRNPRVEEDEQAPFGDQAGGPP